MSTSVLGMGIEIITLREQMVLKMIASGDKWDTITSTLRISKNTLMTHRRVILEKLNAVDTANAVYIATKAGILQ